MDDDDDLVLVCEVCGAEDLLHEGNQARCPHCGTVVVTQQSNAMLSEDVSQAQFRYLSRIHTPAELKEKAAAKAKKERLQPWKLSEAFQTILLAQIAGLQTALDLPDVYRELAVKVWMQYLRATGEAFLTEEERAACPYPNGWGWLFDPEEGKKSFRKLAQSNRSPQLREVDGETAKKEMEMERKIQKMCFDGEISPCESDFDSDSCSLSSSSTGSEVDNDDDDDLKEVKKTRRVDEEESTDRYWCGKLTKGKTTHMVEFNLAVCFLPLLYLERAGRSFSLSDLLSAVCRGDVPYQNARLLLPAWICVRDASMTRLMTRRETHPDRERMEMVVAALFGMVGKGQLPPRPLLSSVDLLVARLRLPALVGTWTKAVARLWLPGASPLAPKRKQRPCRSAEQPQKQGRYADRPQIVYEDFIAASFLLLVLIWLHGDSQEQLQSRDAVVRRLCAATARSDLFLLSEWLNTALHRRDGLRSLGDLRSLDAILELPPVAALVGTAADGEQAEGAACVGRRRIYRHEHVNLVRKRHFVESLLRPLQPLVDGAKPCARQEQPEPEWDFSHHFVVFPREPAEVIRELGRLDRSESELDLFDDADEESVEALVDLLPGRDLLATAMARPGAHSFEEVRGLATVVADAVLCSPHRLWAEAVAVHKVIVDLAGLDPKHRYRCLDRRVGRLMESRKYFSLS